MVVEVVLIENPYDLRVSVEVSSLVRGEVRRFVVSLRVRVDESPLRDLLDESNESRSSRVVSLAAGIAAGCTHNGAHLLLYLG